MWDLQSQVRRESPISFHLLCPRSKKTFSLLLCNGWSQERIRKWFNKLQSSFTRELKINLYKLKLHFCWLSVFFKEEKNTLQIFSFIFIRFSYNHLFFFKQNKIQQQVWLSEQNIYSYQSTQINIFRMYTFLFLAEDKNIVKETSPLFTHKYKVQDIKLLNLGIFIWLVQWRLEVLPDWLNTD